MTEREQLEQAITALEAQRALLGDAVVDTALAPLREKLAALDAKSTEQQRKLMTFLFMDVVSSSKTFGHLDPEDTLNILGNALGVMGEIIQRHEGQVGKLMGDGLMAYFGAPTAREDDAIRAVRAALEITHRAIEYAREIERNFRVAGFQVRVGLNSGLVAFGEVGGTAGSEVTAMGDAVNMAARMEANAPPGGVLISHATYQQVRGIFDVTPLEPILPKGALKPIPVYVVEREKPRAFRPETRGVEGIETHMIGRDAELKHLQAAFHTAMERNETQLVTIIGDAGVGKSRLLFEFNRWLELNPPVTTFRGRALPETMIVPYGLLRNMLAFHFAIHESDLSATVREKLEQGVAEFLGEAGGVITPQERAYAIGHLVGFDLGLEFAGYSPEQATIARHYLTQFIAALSHQPTILMLEDIHWADEATLDMLRFLANELPAQRLLMVCLSRPTLLERHRDWGNDLSTHARLALQPLSPSDTNALVNEILQKVADVPADLRELVVKSADGNPFYVEELVRMFIEDGAIVKGDDQWRVEMERLKQVRVPPTLTGILQARLDSLPPHEKALLQQAAVVGRIFWDQALAHLEAPAGLYDAQAHLDALHGREMIFGREPSTFDGSREYIFKHALLRDVTYETVLKRLRRDYHLQIAAWLVERTGERVKEYLELIAGHYEHAGEVSLAVDYLSQAAQRALDTSYFREGLALVERGLALQPSPAEQMKLLALAGDALGKLDELEAAHARYTACLELAQAHGDRAAQADGLYGLGWLHAQQDEPDLARDYFTQSLAISRELDDQRRISDNLNRLAVAAENLGDYDTARQYHHESIAIRRAIGYQAGIAISLGGLSSLAFNQSDYATSKACLEESLTIWRSLGNRAQISGCMSNLGILARIAKDYATASAYQEASLTIHREVGNRRGVARSLMSLGVIAFEQGDPATGNAYFQQSLALWRELGNKSGAALCLANLGISAAEQGDHDTARPYLEESLSIRRQIGDKFGIASSLHALGDLALEQGNFELARAHLEESLTMRRTLGDKIGEADTLCTLGWLGIAQDDLAAARSHVEDSLAIHRELDAPAESANSLNALGWTLMLQGDPAQAKSTFYEALRHAQATSADSIMVISLVGLASLLVANNQPITALALLALIQPHRIGGLVARQQAESLRRELQNALPADDVAAATEQGQSADLLEVVSNLLTESSE